MTSEREASLTLHGLDGYNHEVDAEVFADKFRTFLKALAAADEIINDTRRYKYMITALVKNTATAQVREYVAVAGEPPSSSVSYYAQSMTAIQNGEPAARRLPKAFLEPVVKLNRDVGKRFAFAEVKLPAGVIIRIDDVLRDKAERLLADIRAREAGGVQWFEGMAYGAFDGVLKAVDLRGEVKLANLILSAGGLEVECTVGDIDLEQVRGALDKRCIVSGLADYVGKGGLPRRLAVRHIEVVESAPPLSNWRGSFSIPDTDDDWDAP
ncbi:hypothetical protein [Labrys neptuniae]